MCINACWEPFPASKLHRFEFGVRQALPNLQRNFCLRKLLASLNGFFIQRKLDLRPGANVNDRQGADLFRRNTSGSTFEALHPSRKPGGTVEGSTVAWEILHAQDKPALATERAEIGVAQHALATQLQGSQHLTSTHTFRFHKIFWGGAYHPGPLT